MIKKLLCRHNFKIRHNFLNNLKVVNVVCNDETIVHYGETSDERVISQSLDFRLLFVLH